ncbi:MAG: tRNA (adenosine(37)-N6)-threonylcarbamoyltransferase complex ATPase subunit type 1 TsaE [Chloroflexi bacterium]|nr:tRNA (adenosine(37)-N6)-threonylcarbamoyltransferase complex ATPase subunit type 1 TsaE [Chloroflexota bacterium]
MSPVLDERMLDFISHSDAQTRRLGARLAALLRGGEVICLEGELGTGKTCLAQGIGKGLGVEEPIVSPSFTLIREYATAPSRPKFIHVDLYRLGEDDLPTLGLEEYLNLSCVVVIEWADRMGASTPEKRLEVRLRFVDDTKRGLTFVAYGDEHRQLLEAFRRSMFGGDRGGER